MSEPSLKRSISRGTKQRRSLGSSSSLSLSRGSSSVRTSSSSTRPKTPKNHNSTKLNTTQPIDLNFISKQPFIMVIWNLRNS